MAHRIQPSVIANSGSSWASGNLLRIAIDYWKGGADLFLLQPPRSRFGPNAATERKSVTAPGMLRAAPRAVSGFADDRVTEFRPSEPSTLASRASERGWIVAVQRKLKEP